MKGKLDCPCGCGLKINKGVEWILSSLERYMIMKLARHFELVVTSGARCEEHNRSVGGAKNSAHVLCLAADIECIDNNHKWIMKRYLYNQNIKRIGDGVAKGKFLHFDIATGKLKYPHDGMIDYPQEVEWSY